MENTFIVQVFFSKHPDLPDNPGFLYGKDETFLDLPLWKPEGSPVYRWAVDYLSARDERWVAFGLFTRAVARSVMAQLVSRPSCVGYKLVELDSADYVFMDNDGAYYHRAWRDGS